MHFTDIALSGIGKTGQIELVIPTEEKHRIAVMTALNDMLGISGLFDTG